MRLLVLARLQGLDVPRLPRLPARTEAARDEAHHQAGGGGSRASARPCLLLPRCKERASGRPEQHGNVKALKTRVGLLSLARLSPPPCTPPCTPCACFEHREREGRRRRRRTTTQKSTKTRQARLEPVLRRRSSRSFPTLNTSPNKSIGVFLRLRIVLSSPSSALFCID